MYPLTPRLIIAPGLLVGLLMACGGGEGTTAVGRSPFATTDPDDGRSAIPDDGRSTIPGGAAVPPVDGEGAGGSNSQGPGGGGNGQGGNGQGGNGESGSNGQGPGGGGDTSAKICDQCDNIVACFEGQVTLDDCKADCDGVSKACADCVKDAGTNCNALLSCQQQACK